MTTYNVQQASRPAAVLMALALMAASWVPTLSAPAQATAGDTRPAPGMTTVATGLAVPVMM